jgi:hypothetical protein
MSDATQQTIDVGAVANDGTGESLRDAFNAVNNNFANVWAAGPVGTEVVIRDNEVTTNVTNLDLKIAGNGVGNVVVASTMRPTIDAVYDLGRPEYRWSEVHAEYYYGNGRFLTGIAGSSGFVEIDANGVVLTSTANTRVSFTASNNLSITANAVDSTIDFAVDSNPVFDTVAANSLSAANLVITDQANIDSVAANTVNVTDLQVSNVANIANLQVTSLAAANLSITDQANIGNISISDNVISSTQANANIVLSPNGTGVVESTANVVAPYFFGNVVGNISGNLTVAGANTGVVFNDSGLANSVANFTFDKSTSAVSVTGNVTAADFNGAGYGLNYVMADRSSDSSNWNMMLKMGTYTVNRVNWGGVTGAPLESNVYIGLLEVKVSNTQGTTLSAQQSYYPGTVDLTNVKMQYNRNYWAGTWTQWIRITNNEQSIDGGSY